MLKVEDGSGVEGADSYVSLVEADDYVEAWHDPTEWEAADERERERALRRGTRQVDEYQFRGRRATDKQSLAWPRAHVGEVDGRWVPWDEVPREIRHATIELAMAIIRGEEQTIGGELLTRERITAGPVTTERQYAEPTRRDTGVDVRPMLRPYLSSSRLERSIA